MEGSFESDIRSVTAWKDLIKRSPVYQTQSVSEYYNVYKSY